MNLLLIDNYDSFSNNIAHGLKSSFPGLNLSVVQNDDFGALNHASFGSFDAIVISPGPGNVDCEKDLGICRAVLESDPRPILGICLGHQAIAYSEGAKVELAKEAVHGQKWRIENDQSGIFWGLPEQFSAVRYHSWVVASELPDSLRLTAWANGVVMGVEHRTKPRWGVQFHPESIGTEHGERVFKNFLGLARDRAAIIVTSKPQNLVFSVRSVAVETDAIRLTETLVNEDRSPALLESALVAPGFSRFSYLAADYGLGDEVITYDQAAQKIRVLSGPDAGKTITTTLIEYLADSLERTSITGPTPAFGFRGGYIGWLGYEFLRDCTNVRAHPSDHEEAALRRVNSFFVFDHASGELFAAVLAPDQISDADLDTVFAHMEKSCIASRHANPNFDPNVLGSNPIAFQSRHEDSAYLSLIKQCQAEIKAGESYELCLTNQVSAQVSLDAWTLYKTLRSQNPGTYAAYLPMGTVDVISSSPERFFSIDETGRVEARPIKGTSRRGLNEQEDRDLVADLVGSVKENAENLMIVDLLRHDLSAVCDPGSVIVPKLCAIETYPHVHHMVSIVTGQLSKNLGMTDVLRACFPGGSMTGAPKTRSIEILHDLEGGPRGVYSGAIGWIGLDGQTDLSIVIRTIVLQDGEASIGCGGAITILSDPEEELQEIKLKARAMLRTIAEAQTGNADNYTLDGGDPHDVVPTQMNVAVDIAIAK